MLVYLNSFSLVAVQLVEFIRRTLGTHSLGLTFDAGPHPVLFINPAFSWLVSLLARFFASAASNARLKAFLEEEPKGGERVGQEEIEEECERLGLKECGPSYLILSRPE